MASPLLETKFHVPRRRRELVARSRLSERLSRIEESAVTLVSAPAGFGKTTLLTEWLAARAAAALPIAAWEFSLGVWLVVKGFKPSPITSNSTTTVRDLDGALVPAVA